MRLSITALYAARISATETSARSCPLRYVDGHVCSPLCPWLHHLRGRLEIEYANDANASAMLRPARFDALALTLYASAVSQSLEAIELVLLAAQLDPVTTWETVIRTGCLARNYLPSLMANPAEITPRLRLVPDQEAALWKSLRWLRRPWHRSPSYWLTRKWLLHEHRRYSEEQPLQRISVAMQWRFKLTRSLSLTDHLCKLAASDDARQTRFQLTEVDCQMQERDGDKGNDWSFSEADLLRLQQAGVHFQFSTVHDLTSTECRSKVSLRGDIPTPIKVFKCTGSVRALPSDWWRNLRGVGGIKQVHVSMHHPRQWMRFEHRAIAAALLDPRSTTSVEHVYLDGSMSNEALNDMLQVVTSHDPFEHLGWGQLPVSHPLTRSHLRTLSVEPHASFEKSLFFELLRIIGSRLETLSIDFFGGWLRLEEDDLVMLFIACPQLQCLSLSNVSLASLDLIVSAYNAGLCRSLQSFLHAGLVDDLASVARLLEACNNPRQQLHRTLRDVELKHHRKYPASVLHRILAAIQCNRTLRHIALDLVKEIYSNEPRDALLRMSETPVLVHSGKLPLAHKLAFLSAALSRLDQDACRLVLEFSIGMEPRRVVCVERQKDLDW